ncbi:MAG: aminoacetone oxidase family FAD-binding enzyme, partial [Smithellaceae bacterium]|nr:aminoacetone oxidase family FAD-binding enzyme [Smithellaceae bacterium]
MKETVNADKRVIVAGGGAAGLLAAGRAAELGASVLLLEKNDQLGKKILISGKGRCNLTNTKPLEEFIGMYGPNGRFLYRAFRHFFQEDLIGFLERYGLKAKAERGGRIFPVTDEAADVVRACQRYLQENKVEIRLNSPVTDIEIRDGRMRGVHTRGFFLPAQAVILATGGASYPGTGSSGDGYRLARAAGHSIIPLRPALIPLVVEEIDLAASMQGVTLKNVRLTSFSCRAEELGKVPIPSSDVGRGVKGPKARPPVIESRQGEMMMTHFGVGGPVVLLMSLAVTDALARGPVSIAIDLKPALNFVQLDRRLQTDLADFGKRGLKGILSGLVPKSLIAPLARLINLPLDKPAHQLRAEERTALAGLLKSLRFNIRSPLPIEHAIVTAGGVALAEIDPRRLASRI